MMALVPEFEYLVPETLQEACGLLDRYGAGAKVLAGGSDLIVKMKRGLVKADYLVSTKRLQELRGISYQEGVGVVIGARMTHNEVATSPVLKERYPSVCSAAKTIGSYQIRNIGTIGGNIVNAVPSADMPPILIALQGQARIVSSKGERGVALEEFFVGPGETVLETGELLKSVVIPDQRTTGSVYLKFGLRKASALAVVGVASAVEMEGEVVKDIRIVLGAVAPTPIRAVEAEGVLRGRKVTAELLERAGEVAAKESKPITDIRGSAEYRRHLVNVLVRRSVEIAIERGHV